MRFLEVFINVHVKIIEQLYEQNARNVVTRNYKNNVGQLYYICDPGIDNIRLLARHSY